MSTQQILVERFLHSWSVGLEEFCVTVEKVFTDTTIWENVGYSTTTGAAEAVEHLRKSAGRLGWTRVDAAVLVIAPAGDQVVTERVDHHLDADGQVLFSIRCASVFDLSEDRITAIREYFDTAPLVAAGAAGCIGE
ncbi:limonene-1,2-epoxide hydrolase family protein [Streptomyces shenzhenensis]|uniref:Limonene-1,2-epoxide hydrolase domain-containing protein n=1 Tax=Streptomyces shenzhenensis TaxID=943815 RepID=A0A3M0I6C9_9ACTN|nr:limonene-1,2-epoxide hydrolase family protein [Streptomyces shenzhenensis]RMB83740.1 hypothetical protein CTZ28_21700 [Streptomyces shenzhenensis]